MPISTEICNFYRDTIASVKIQLHSQGGGVKKIFPISGFDFNAGAVLAIIFLVQKIAQSIFFLVCSIVTLGLHDGMRTSFLKNAKS
jgi:hypothetical protein